MPYRTLDLAEAASYLHLTRVELEHLVRTSDIPFVTRGSRIAFLRGALDEWASRRILGAAPKSLDDIHRRSTQASQEYLEAEALLPSLLKPGQIDLQLPSKTKKSALRDIVALAETTGAVLDPAALRASLEEREELCSTALPGGFALLHSRHHQEYLFESSFIAFARTLQEIHFGSPDGLPTRLFFLVCCHDERLHLHALARLCTVLLKSDVVPLLFSLSDRDELYDALIAAEKAVLEGRKRTRPAIEST
ncbi:MAG: PTS sugar transporter subunit IIA [Opitutaceae bacterium]|nr:PTS sugar transporter subunit IIA [Opitutaceae bacterium]